MLKRTEKFIRFSEASPVVNQGLWVLIDSFRPFPCLKYYYSGGWDLLNHMLKHSSQRRWLKWRASSPTPQLAYCESGFVSASITGGSIWIHRISKVLLRAIFTAGLRSDGILQCWRGNGSVRRGTRERVVSHFQRVFNRKKKCLLLFISDWIWCFCVDGICLWCIMYAWQNRKYCLNLHVTLLQLPAPSYKIFPI